MSARTPNSRPSDPSQPNRSRALRRALALVPLVAVLAAVVPAAVSSAAETSTLAFAASSDTHVSEAKPKRPHGSASSMWVDGSPRRVAYLKFSVTGTGDVDPTGARLRLYQLNASSAGGSVRRVAATGWSESITWNTRPAVDGSPLASFGAVTSGRWHEVDLGDVVSGDGTLALAITSSIGDGANWATRETATKPQLLVDLPGTAAPPASGSIQRTFTPTRDTFVDASEPSSTKGGLAALGVDASPVKISYLRFDVDGIADAPVTRAVLRLYQTDSSPEGGSVARVPDAGWGEALTWSAAPEVGALLGTLGPVVSGRWYELDVTGAVGGAGTVSFAVTSTNGDGSTWASRETPTPPELVVTAGGTAEPGPATSTSPSPSSVPTETSSPSPTPAETLAPSPSVTPTPPPAPTTCVGVPIRPGDPVQALLDANPTGTTFCFAAGTFRLGTDLNPRSGQKLIGAPGAVLNGAKVITNWSSDGSAWVATGQTQQSTTHGSCSGGYEGCRYNEQVFYDGQPLWRVMSRSEVGAGKFYFDYANDRIYIGNNPSGHLVEGSVAHAAVDGPSSSSNVTISGFVVEKFASKAQEGAIDTGGASGWTISHNEVRFNHGAGISHGGNGTVVRRNDVHHNGQLGLHASNGADILVVDNEVAFNNTAGFSYGWEAGGTKWVKTTRLTVRGNHSHDNRGPGLWTDIDNIDVLYEDNLVENNVDAGIFHEISYDAVIRNNVIRYNGFDRGDWLWGSGIQIAASPNVEVYGNLLDGNANGIGVIQQSRGSGAYGVHEVRNISVHDNDVRMAVGGTGAVQDVGDSSVFSSRNITFTSNDYRLGSGTRYFRWANGSKTVSEWKSYGQDVGGTFSSL